MSLPSNHTVPDIRAILPPYCQEMGVAGTQEKTTRREPACIAYNHMLGIYMAISNLTQPDGWWSPGPADSKAVFFPLYLPLDDPKWPSLRRPIR